MASQEAPSDEGRPPDTPIISRKHLSRKLAISSISRSHGKYSSYLSGSVPSNKFLNRSRDEYSRNIDGFKDLLEDNIKLVHDVNRNNMGESTTTKVLNRSEKPFLKNSLPKLLCLKKSSTSNAVKIERSSLKTLNVNSLETMNSNRNFSNSGKSVSKTSLDIRHEITSSPKPKMEANNTNYFSDKTKNRNSFHQNVEEALNSLLWQPYEYQNNNGNYEDSYSTGSLTPSSSSSADLDETIESATKKTPSFLFHCNPTQDLHSNVINLCREDRAGQSEGCARPRDSISNGSAVAFARLASPGVELRSCTTPGDFLTGDVYFHGCGHIMHSAPSVNGQESVPSGTKNSGIGENGLGACQNHVDASLKSVNIVGLPSSHSRFASVPSGTFQTRSQSALFPQHVRNVSEPADQFLRYQSNGVRSGTQVDQNNLLLINHFRSSSVPKSMPKNESTNLATPNSRMVNKPLAVPPPQQGQNLLSTPSISNQTRLLSKPISTVQSNNNVSNVNVNFYRAVPVNVVSSVPTIHCLNTLSNDQGNSVSNVQVLPLTGNFQVPLHQNVAGSNSNFVVLPFPGAPSNNTTSYVSSGTQVTVHNTNNIQIGSAGAQVSRGTAFSAVPTQETRNIASVSTNTNNFENFMISPLGTVVPSVNNNVTVQNFQAVRPEVPTLPLGGRLITTTAQINNASLESQHVPPPINTNIVRTRTFTSTEAQTDDILPVSHQSTAEQISSSREQRRRERRERRHNRRANNQNHPRNTSDSSTQAGGGTVQSTPPNNNRLPDILNSHLPPPYSTLPSAQTSILPPPPMVPGAMLPHPHGPVLQTVVPNAMPASAFVFSAPPPVVAGQVPLMQGAQAVPVAVPASASGFRFPFPANGFRRSRFSEDTPKGCCGFLTWKPGSLRWFIALIALVAVCCVLVGTALGAMRPAGRDHLTVSLLMIGVGIVLITVSGVAWRLTSHDSSTCRSMLGLGSTESVDVCTRRFVPRLPPSYGRPHHPYAAMMYPEFQYRPPPPSYQASMQEYRLRLLLLDRGNTPQIQAGLQNAVSPPPTYRSHAGSLLRAPLSSRRDANQSEYSCPPSYRSQNSSNRPGTLQNGSMLHSREHSLTVSDSNHESVVNVVNILGSTEEDIALDNITLDSLKMEPETDMNPLKMLLKGSQSDLEGSKDGNLVTIVQTSDQHPVIVTVSGCSHDNGSSVQITEIPSEMEILAHL